MQNLVSMVLKFLIEKIMFLQYWKSILMVLKLKEFLSATNFLVDENQIENELWQIPEIVKTTGVSILTCQK
jgi:hypothetical protein